MNKSLFFVSSVLILPALCVGTSEEVREVSCALGTNCILPCSFHLSSYSSHPFIYWLKKPGDEIVHSYYYQQNQDQDEAYRDRTALFEGNIQRGNASLWLSEVKVQDEGEYVCLTGTTTDKQTNKSRIFLSVFVDFGVVDLVRRGSELVCRAEGLYPKPTVIWSSGLWFFEVKTKVHQREDQLYDITSSITPQPNAAAPDPHKKQWPSCTVGTRRSSRTVILTKEYRLGVYYNDAVLSCLDFDAPSLIWKFSQTQIILTRSGSNSFFNESWRQFVDRLTESNHLILKDLTKDQEGLYSCHVITDTDIYVNNIQLEIEVEEKNKEMIGFRFVWIFKLLFVFFCGYLVGLYKLKLSFPQRIRGFFSRSELRERSMNIPVSQQESWTEQNDNETLPNPASPVLPNPVTDTNTGEPREMTPKKLSGHRRSKKKKH
ncbi:CD276 antigen-like [Boleophthalmus pectinirostris]|uniref:CD276 antigen-like n=1 Tax=Boleophthalmus pectinirostris TaxID=150288 RepID=UPI00242AA61C|nr:CD276 antigen-like [Boleophthalmus pectinirostris]